MLFGSGGSVGVEGPDSTGIAGFDMMEFGADGVTGSNYHVRGVHGKTSTLTFGIGGIVTLVHPKFLEYKQPWSVLDTDVYFRSQSTKTRPAARYFAAKGIDLGPSAVTLPGLAAPSMVAPWRMPKIPPSQTDTIITVQMGEEGRLDIIALAVWGRSDWWWVLALANDILNPFEEPVAGDRLRVPTQTRVLREVIGVESTGTEIDRVRERF